MKLAILFMLFLSYLFSNEINLTDEEKNWIEKHPIIKIGTHNIPPYMMLENDNLQGYYIDILSKALEVVNLKFEYTSIAPLETVLENLKNGKVDLSLALFISKDREKYIDFSSNHFNINIGIFASKFNTKIKNFDSLKNKKIATYKKYGLNKFIYKYFDTTNIVMAENAEDMMQLVEQGKADACFQEFYSGNYMIYKNNLHSLESKEFLNSNEKDELEVAMWGVSKNSSILRAILDKAYQTIPMTEIEKIRNKWFKDIHLNQFTLTEDERKYLDNNTFHIYINNWEPFVILQNSSNKELEIQGIAIDFWKYLTKDTNIKYQFIKVDKFTKILDGIKNDSNGLTLSTAKTKDKEEYSSFSEIYNSFPIAIMTKNDKTFENDISNFNGLKIAVGKNFTAHSILKKYYPKIELVLVKNTFEALDLVDKGEAFGAADILPVLNYLSRKYTYDNLKINGLTEQNYDIRIVVNKKNSKLIDIINKLMVNLPDNTVSEINKKYEKIIIREKIDYTYIAIAFIVLITIIIWYLYKNRLLLKQKNYELNTLNNELANINELLTKEKDRFELAVKGSDHGIFDWDIVNNKVYYSPRWKSLIGYEDDEILNDFSEWKSRVHPDDLVATIKLVEAYLEHKTEIYDATFRMQHKNGNWVWINARGKAKIVDGKPVRMVGFHTDMSELIEYRNLLELKVKEQIREIESAKELTKNIIDNAPVRIFWKNTENIYVGANKLFLKDAKLQSEEDIIGKTDYDMIWKKDAKLYIDDDNTIMQSKIPKLQYEEPQTYEDGTMIYLRTSKIPLLDEDGKVYGILGIYDDITEQKNKDIILLDKTKMAALGEMIGNIAHQWRQPLSAITSAASGISFENEIRTLDDEKIEFYTKGIIKNAQHLSQTIDTFRDFVKGENKIESIKIKNLIEFSLIIIKDSLINNQIEIINNISSEISEMILHISPNEFTEVILNILNNAKDVIRQKHIKNAWIKFDAKKQNSSLIISIEDNAGGIPENIINRIFEPYFTTKHQSQGTGLGLHMSYKLVSESFNGKLYVKNSENGAMFFIEIPV